MESNIIIDFCNTDNDIAEYLAKLKKSGVPIEEYIKELIRADLAIKNIIKADLEK